MKTYSLAWVQVLLLTALPAAAQDLGVRSFGVRGGLAANPDQFAFGAHVDLGRLNESLRFQPSAELGWGNGVLLGSANFDLHYLFGGHRYRPYAGGGLGLNAIDVRNGFGQGSGLDLEPVVNLVGGLEWGTSPKRARSRAPYRYLAEARVGMGDTPELKLVFGLNF
jgi:hypothetical protein